MTERMMCTTSPRARRAIAAAILAAGIAAPLAFSAPAQAATATAVMTVSASIASVCSVNATSMSFGTYTPTAASTATAPIQVTCSNGVTAQVSLNQGQHNGAASTYGTRALNGGGANNLGYDIYTDTTYSTVWNTTNTVPVTSTGSAVTLTAAGRVPAGQTPEPGSYNDSVTITVTF